MVKLRNWKCREVNWSIIWALPAAFTGTVRQGCKLYWPKQLASVKVTSVFFVYVLSKNTPVWKVNGNRSVLLCLVYTLCSWTFGSCMCFDCLVTGWLCELTVCCKCGLPGGVLMKWLLGLEGTDCGCDGVVVGGGGGGGVRFCHNVTLYSASCSF